MGAPTNLDEVMGVVSKVFLWCFAIGVLFVVGWFGVFLVGKIGDIGYEIHAEIFDVTKHEFDMMHYYGMTFVKICIFWFFLVPYVAIRLVMMTR